MAAAMFLSVRQTFENTMRLHDLEPWVAKAWALSVAKAQSADAHGSAIALLFSGRIACQRRLSGIGNIEHRDPLRGTTSSGTFHAFAAASDLDKEQREHVRTVLDEHGIRLVA